MLRFGKLSLGILLGAFAGFLADAARADNVDLLSFNNISWDIGSSPTASPPVTISIQNMTAGSANAIFNGYDLEFNFTSTAGTGAVVLGSVANPTANAVISNFLTPPTTSGNYVGNTSSAGSTNYVVPSTGATNLVTVTFAYSGSGAFPAVGSTIGVFADRKVSDYLDFNGNTTAYANNLATNAQDVEIGTITVTPEPSTLALLGVGALLGVPGYLWRQTFDRSGQRLSVSDGYSFCFSPFLVDSAGTKTHLLPVVA